MVRISSFLLVAIINLNLSTAAIARQVYLHQGIGVGHLCIKFGGNKRRGTKPNRFARSSTNVVRSALKSLEAAGLIEKSRDGGRKISKAGQRELDTIAATVAN